MPLRRGRGKAVTGPDPLTACLDANGTYICTAFNPRCYIIQKVIPNPHPGTTPLNPNADEFHAKPESNVDPETATQQQIGREFLHHQSHTHLDYSYPLILDGYVYMNGDVGKLPPGAVYSTTPETGAAMGTVPEYVAVNGVTEGAEGLSPIPPSAPQDNASQSAYPLPQLKQMLSQQLEYYFSRENLANDTYLISQMDNDQYVPIWTVANFNQVKKLTKDIKLITEVLKESPNVQVDEEGLKVRPNHKRCIVILREVPDSTPIEDVKNLFSGENCPRFISCEFAHNNNWYVTFESDDDAQVAFKYLREEVREFQGKPIMARIKAKPMNRLPMPTGPVVKNGFRATPPPTAVYDPAAFPPGQQRFIYTNGTPSPYSQVPIYSPYQQQQQYYTSVTAWPTPSFFDISSVFQVNGLAPQPYKHPSYRSNTRPRNKPSRTSNQSDQSSQGSSQGGGSQGSSRQTSHVPPSVSPHTNNKPNNSNSNNGANSNNSSSSKGTLIQGDLTRTSGLVHNVVADSQDAHAPSVPIGLPILHQIDMTGFIPVIPNKEIVAPRHRRKKREDENLTNSQPVQAQTREHVNSRGAQFDLVEEAFPPLPGLDAGNQSLVKQTQVAVEVLQSQIVTEVQQPQGHWGENRLADVVKGTVKAKGSSKESSNDNESPRATSPQHFPQCTQTFRQASITASSEIKDAVVDSGNIQLSTVTLTPPSSPEKLVPVLPTKCTMADKSTKTDDALLNGELDMPCPTTTNAATMTTVVPTEAPSRPIQVAASTSTKPQILVHKQDSRPEVSKHPPSPPPISDNFGNPPRMSYAQVAQHHKEAHAQKEKQIKEKQIETTAPVATTNYKPTTSTNNSSNNNNSSNSNRVQGERDNVRDFKDNGQARDGNSSQQQTQQRHSAGPNRSSGSRSGHERSQRRRPENRTQLRDFVPRSPK